MVTVGIKAASCESPRYEEDTSVIAHPRRRFPQRHFYYAFNSLLDRSVATWGHPQA
jgi:hypothetical protein